MASPSPKKAAVIDYGLGNLFSVAQACSAAKLVPTVTSAAREIASSDVVILPGIGAFADAMASLGELGLVPVLRDVASSGQLLVGICLGLQLLMDSGEEFGFYEGLGVIEGTVVPFKDPRGPRGPLKVPQIGWNGIHRAAPGAAVDPWQRTPLEGLDDGTFMYFTHTFYVEPADPNVVLSTSRYGDIEFCSSVRQANIYGFQFHPERSGPHGLAIYGNISALAGATKVKHA